MLWRRKFKQAATNKTKVGRETKHKSLEPKEKEAYAGTWHQLKLNIFKDLSAKDRPIPGLVRPDLFASVRNTLQRHNTAPD